MEESLYNKIKNKVIKSKDIHNRIIDKICTLRENELNNLSSEYKINKSHIPYALELASHDEYLEFGMSGIFRVSLIKRAIEN